MKLNLDQIITDLRGKPIPFKEEKDSPEKDLTLRDVAQVALLNDAPQEQLTGDQRFRLGRLAEKIHAGGEVELKTDQIAKIKERIGKLWGTMVVTRAWSLIDGPAADDKDGAEE
jgi:hypothetical protein